MTKKQQATTGISAASLLLLVLHLYHFTDLLTDGPDPHQNLKTGNAIVILTDSITKKKDTVTLQEYLKSKRGRKQKATGDHQ